jgi:hypothetical protein
MLWGALCQANTCAAGTASIRFCTGHGLAWPLDVDKTSTAAPSSTDVFPNANNWRMSVKSTRFNRVPLALQRAVAAGVVVEPLDHDLTTVDGQR